MRQPVIAGNWKMNLLQDEAADLIDKLKHRLATSPPVAQVVVAPPFTALAVAARKLQGSPIQLAAQNMGWESKGAFTGEISAPMLKDAGCSFVILGHSERRQHCGENDELIRRKIQRALEHDLNVFFCVGETLRQREQDATREVVECQVRQGLQGFSEHDLERIVVAYEPVWAIGTGKTAAPEQAQEAHRFIRDCLGREFGAAAAETTRIQYGGSVNPDNSAALLGQADIDGALVGSASLQPESFYGIIQSVN